MPISRARGERSKRPREGGVQQKLIRHADIRATKNIYGDVISDDMRATHQKVVGMALPVN